jgi:hypothetical protein
MLQCRLSEAWFVRSKLCVVYVWWEDMQHNTHEAKTKIFNNLNFYLTALTCIIFFFNGFMNMYV